jgi:diaminopimelate epimerase
MKVSKYNASGNDFVVFHTFVNENRSVLAKRLCDRTNGIGADGLIVLLPNGENSIKWEFYNSDGSMAAMCGNGSRAAFAYAYKNGLIGANATLLSGAGLIGGKIWQDIVEVELTNPKKLSEKFDESGFTWHFYDTGVPHLVTFVDNLAKFDLEIARTMRYKYNANVNFALIKDKENSLDANLLVRTYERGVENETLACGTGMAACFYAGFKLNFLGDSIKVKPKSGEILGLRLENGKIFFSGCVNYCFDANFNTSLILDAKQIKDQIKALATHTTSLKPNLLYEQEIINIAYLLYPEVVDELRGGEFDCFYDDRLVETFLEKLAQKLC